MNKIEEPTLLQTVRAHSGEVTCADAFGARLVTGGGDRALRLHLWASGGGWRETAAARGAHRYGVTAARWAPAGALLASAGVDGALRVWSRALEPRRTLAAAGAAAARALCWAGGARLLAGHDDGALYVWHVPRAIVLARLAAHEGALYAIAAPAACTLLLTACTEGVLKVFDLVEVCRSAAEGPAPTALEWVDNAHDLGVMCADAAVDGRYAATGGHDAKVRLWRAERDEASERWALRSAGALEGHSDTVTALRWAGSLLASAALDRTARLWRPHTAACLHVLHAHARYLTCIVLSVDQRYMVTGSNDKSVRMWSLSSLTLDGELAPLCDPLAHFALGDLEGIGAVDEDELLESDAGAGEGARRVWRSQAHAAAVNCIAAHAPLLATASSDGTVKIFRWSEDLESCLLQHTLAAHEYPALACALGAGGALLLSGGLDGCARLWDVQMGCVLRSLAVPGGGGGGGGGGVDAGGGGVRGAGVSPQRPPLLLLVTDDGLAPLWSLADPDPLPSHVYGGHASAALCCAWAGGGRALATGGAGGELLLRAPPPCARDLHCEPHAHEGGVQSCDFAAAGSVQGLAEATLLLASAGADDMLKLWAVEIDEDVTEARVSLLCSVLAHGGGAACVRWGAGGLVASAGGDRWARVWRAAAGGRELRAVAAVPAGAAGGAPAVALLSGLLAVGSLSGELALWRLPADEDALNAEDADPPRFWDEAGAARWLREYVARVPGVPGALGADAAAALERLARAAAVTGAKLLDVPLNELLEVLGCGEDSPARDPSLGEAARARLAEELHWLRRPPPPARLAWQAPHALLCPVSHLLLSAPCCAADGRSYCRAALREWALAAGRASPAGGPPLRHLRLQPNYKLTEQLRAFLMLHDSDPNA